MAISGRWTRRNFLQMTALGALSLAAPALSGPAQLPSRRFLLPEFPTGEKLGRVIGGRVKIGLRPDEDSAEVGELFDDQVVPWLREVVGRRPLWQNQRFVETPQGYIYAPNLQPVRNQPNQPLTQLPSAEGMWVEVTVPYVDLLLANPPPRSPWLRENPRPRLYYSQIMWVDQIRLEQGQVWYHVTEKYGSYGDHFWADGAAFRPLTAQDLQPISPQVEDKLVVVRLLHQTLACYEGKTEVYFCRVSTGDLVKSQDSQKAKWATPPGKHTIWRKLVSVHMSGGTTGGGYDLPGIGWTTLFSGQGMAIHSTFWHNSYGIPRSHGCVNAAPEDAQWIFRWTLPFVDLEPGDLTVDGQASTRVLVEES